MKRPLHLLLIVSLISALAGAGLAWRQSVERARQGAASEASAALAKQRKAKKTAAQLAALVRSADKAVFVSYVGGKKELRVSDPNWISRLSTVLGSAACEPTAPGLWILTPQINFYSGERLVLTLTLGGSFLQVLYAPQLKGLPSYTYNFVIEPENAESLAALERQFVHS